MCDSQSASFPEVDVERGDGRGSRAEAAHRRAAWLGPLPTDGLRVVRSGGLACARVRVPEHVCAFKTWKKEAWLHSAVTGWPAPSELAPRGQEEGEASGCCGREDGRLPRPSGRAGARGQNSQTKPAADCLQPVPKAAAARQRSHGGPAGSGQPARHR